MPDLLKIEGVHPSIDGTYPIDASAFTNRDYHDIKRLANIRALEIQEAFDKGDMDLFVAFAAIALRHAGKPPVDDALWDAPTGCIKFEAGDEEEVEDLPPVSAPPSGAPSAPVGGEKPSEKSEPSGDPSRSETGNQDSDLSPIGTPPSATGSMSPLATSAT